MAFCAGGCGQVRGHRRVKSAPTIDAGARPTRRKVSSVGIRDRANGGRETSALLRLRNPVRPSCGNRHRTGSARRHKRKSPKANEAGNCTRGYRQRTVEGLPPEPHC